MLLLHKDIKLGSKVAIVLKQDRHSSKHIFGLV